MAKVLEGVKNIIFDLGGVLLNVDYEKTIQEFSELGVRDFGIIFSQYKQKEIANTFEVGAISEKEFYEEIKKRTQIDFSFLQFKYAWNAMLLDLPKHRLNILRNLSKSYRLFLFSNTNETHYKEFINVVQGDFDTIFEKTYYSHFFGKRKPDKESFLTILNENGLKSEETLFFDDSKQHVEGALKAGLHARWTKGIEECEISKLGL